MSSRPRAALRYLGGKARYADAIATLIDSQRRGRRWWDPFCGGLSVSLALARRFPGTASDINPALIALYSAVRAGWRPPTKVSEAEYAMARTLSDTDPLKAFIGIGCSFGGKWFGGYARDPQSDRDYAGPTAKALNAARRPMQAITFECKSFFDEAPRALPLVIYADPPYAGTTGYDKAGEFDHERFWANVQAWERHGVPVLVSEYTCPVPHRVVWAKRVGLQVVGGSDKDGRLERIFRVEV